MRKEIIYEMTSPYRDTFRIHGFWFGNGEKTVAIVGTMRGDEVQQQYITATLVKRLCEIERNRGIEEGKSILVIPTCNPFSLNVNHRFWSMDGTDINRMFPGYDRGETTQRIAAAVFEHIKDFQYGIQLASYYVAGDFIPHVRMLQTGYEAIEEAKHFQLPFITLRKPLPFDTTLLNYNWQIWGSKAFSIYSGHTDSIDEEKAEMSLTAILRFLGNIHAIVFRSHAAAYSSTVVDEHTLINIQAQHAGILKRILSVGSTVCRGDLMAYIIDPITGITLEEVRTVTDGAIFFSHHKPMVYQNALLYKILPI